jgi:ABC-2 type transport system ATP-binding protein
MTPVLEVHHLTRKFGAKVALNDVSLTVPRGGVFGLVGINGSGKTTFIKHVLGLLRAQEGMVRVFGLDPVADPVGALSRIGYLSEDNDLPDWMRVSEALRYTAAFYPDWDFRYAEDLQRQFELPPEARIRSLSRGQKARVGLLLALAHRPELLVLDEPSSGLDPLARRDILGAIVRTIGDEGRTVLFSSHLLDEVERVADRVAMIHAGRVVYSAALTDVQEGHRKVTLRFEEARDQPPALAGALAWEGSGHEWTALYRGAVSEVRVAVAAVGGRIVEEHVPHLDDIFVAQVGRSSVVAEE